MTFLGLLLLRDGPLGSFHVLLAFARLLCMSEGGHNFLQRLRVFLDIGLFTVTPVLNSLLILLRAKEEFHRCYLKNSQILISQAEIT